MQKVFTADNVTDDEIRTLRNVLKPRGVGDTMCLIALGLPLPDKTSYGDPLNWNFDPSDPTVRTRARAHCARMLNARAEVKS